MWFLLSARRYDGTMSNFSFLSHSIRCTAKNRNSIRSSCTHWNCQYSHCNIIAKLNAAPHLQCPVYPARLRAWSRLKFTASGLIVRLTSLSCMPTHITQPAIQRMLIYTTSCTLVTTAAATSVPPPPAKRAKVTSGRTTVCSGLTTVMAAEATVEAEHRYGIGHQIFFCLKIGTSAIIPELAELYSFAAWKHIITANQMETERE